MFATVKPDRRWSDIGLRTLIGSVVAAVVLSLLHGIWMGPIEMAHLGNSNRATFIMFADWIVDFRYLAEQAVYAATIFFVGAKFFETRSILTIGFDRIDPDKIVLKEPGDDHIVWIGHRYANALEADAVARAFADRLKQSAA